MARLQPKEYRVDIVLNFLTANFELRYLQPEKKIRVDTRVSLLNFARSLSQLPISQYRTVTYLMLTLLTIGTVLCLCILLTQELALIVLACLLILLFLLTIPISLYQYKRFCEQAAKIAGEFVSEREEVKIDKPISLGSFCSLIFKTPKTIFCAMRVLPQAEEPQTVQTAIPATAEPLFGSEEDEGVDVIYEYQPVLNYAIATNRLPAVKSNKYKYPSDPLVNVSGRTSGPPVLQHVELAHLAQIETGTDEAFQDLEKRTKSERHNSSIREPGPTNNDLELPPGSGHFNTSVSIDMSSESD